MNLADITPLILTWNEEPNLRRCLKRLRWASRIVIVDSGSTDGTLGIAAEFPQVEVVERAFDNHTAQWNHGLDHVRTPWVLSLDADYLTPESLPNEVSALASDEKVVAYAVSFRYCVQGAPLRGTLYPPRIALFRKDKCRYIQDGHTQLLNIAGESGKLASVIDHDDRKPLSRWLDSQKKYAVLEAEKLLAEARPAGWPDRLRKKIWPAVPATLVYTLFVKGLILDGWPGLYYVFQRTYAELLLSLELLDKRLSWTAPDRNRIRHE